MLQICIGFLFCSVIGWGPYSLLMCWSLVTDATEVTMIAATLPPLFAKGCTALYPIGYLLTSDKIRDFMFGGFCQEEKKKSK